MERERECVGTLPEVDVIVQRSDSSDAVSFEAEVSAGEDGSVLMGKVVYTNSAEVKTPCFRMFFETSNMTQSSLLACRLSSNQMGFAPT